MKIKVRVKTWEEIEKICEIDEDGNFLLKDFEIYFYPGMKVYCGKIIELEDWGGVTGILNGRLFALPMFKSIIANVE